MASSISQLKKLRGRNVREIGVRGRQELDKLGERLLGFASVEMSDQELFRQIAKTSRNGSGEGSAWLAFDRIRSSSNLPFFPSLASRSEISTMARKRFAAERRVLLEAAEGAINGRFHLLGFGELSFGQPIDWHLDPTTGKQAPLSHWSKINYLDPQVAGDKKVIWELNRHAHFVTLGQAYWLTGDERFAEAFTAQASSWMDANPPKLGINWASSLEVSFRVIAWLWALHLFADSDRLSSKFIARLFKYIIAQGRHIESYLSHYFSPNTHLTGEALGLLYLGIALPELARAQRWRDTGLAVLLKELPRHIGRDGVYFERSSCYHRYTTDFYTHLVLLARAANIELPGGIQRRLSLALDHLMSITRPDGSSPLYGDDDAGRLLALNARPAQDFRDTLGIGAGLSGRGDWKFVAGQAPFEMLWLLGPKAVASFDDLEAKPPSHTSRAFTESGYVVMRDGWSRDSSCLLVDCGDDASPKCGHSHAAALSFEYSAQGKTWLADSGTFTYTGDASLRDWFRGTAAHNTVTVDDQPQSIPAGPFSWEPGARSGAKEFIGDDDFDYFAGSHDGYERLIDPVNHRRSLLFLKERDGIPPFVFVRDRFNARAGHRYSLRYHLASECSATARNTTINAVDNDARALSISVFGEGSVRARVEESWVSGCYGHRTTAAVAVFEAEGQGRQDFVTLISSGTDAAAAPAIQQVLVSRPGAMRATDHPSRVYSIIAGESRDILVMGSRAQEIEYERLTISAEAAWVRMIGDRFRRGCMVKGRQLQVAQCFAFSSPTIVRSCAIRIRKHEIDINITGASRFDLSFHNSFERVVINKSSFALRKGSRAAHFALDGSGWQIIGED